jgi:hypothetical protein
VFKKNISDGVGSQNESIDTRLYPPLFWLDNIFNLVLVKVYRGQRELRGLRPLQLPRADLNEWHCSVSAVKKSPVLKLKILKV